MPRTPRKIFSARWNSSNSGIVSLTHDWKDDSLPPLFWEDRNHPLLGLHKAPPLVFGDESGYFSQGAWVTFCIRASRYPNFDLEKSGVFVAGVFNDWKPDFSRKAWKLDAAIIGGQEYFLLNVQKDFCCGRGKAPFKFITGWDQWMEVPSGAPNVMIDEHGNHNLYIHPYRTGHHQFYFTPPVEIYTTTGPSRVAWIDDNIDEKTPMMPGEYLFSVDSQIKQGAQFVGGGTIFRIFAPRAHSVQLVVYRKPDRSDQSVYEAARVDMGTWETIVPSDCHGAFYFYRIDGFSDAFGDFDPSMEIMDPWALACAGPGGPGIVVDPARVDKPVRRFTPPHWQDLVIAETHVRDLAANAPLPLSPDERLGFSGLAKWVRHPDFYLKKLGVNAVELQPIQQNDEPTKEGYHWGYMTTNYFSPNSHYSLRPENCSQIDEFRDLVAAFHEREMAVIVDVVYNHVGEPNFLRFIDKQYYFDLSADGKFANWSGCGNTLNCATPMMKKLMIESLSWLIEAFDVDGFRFDLAELVGIETLKEVEKALKSVKPSVILIAEPWSFRGHIGYALKDTGFASWNDGYREYVRRYLTGQENSDGLKYFICGSLDHISAWPAQSVNYVESHDDFCWMDRITENSGANALYPTPTDRRRTHLMCAILMMSIGVPMLSGGQDFLRSKLGHNNTYKRGDINALDYRRLRFFSGTHEYFRKWIAFRGGHLGKLLRLWQKPEKGYVSFYGATGAANAIGMLFNADFSMGKKRLFFAVNPAATTCQIQTIGIDLENAVQIADTENFEPTGLPGAERLATGKSSVEIPPTSCALWVMS